RGFGAGIAIGIDESGIRVRVRALHVLSHKSIIGGASTVAPPFRKGRLGGISLWKGRMEGWENGTEGWTGSREPSTVNDELLVQQVMQPLNLDESAGGSCPQRPD
ncbi:hypothetical protein JXA88_13115, partial [Candidatus Fermentibacteria bacterium]|nr:hypothetical protein [Candidatus Fermentibacteria bacterium]